MGLMTEMKVETESEKVGSKLNIQKTSILKGELIHLKRP